jgi:hypothetical protein
LDLFKKTWNESMKTIIKSAVLISAVSLLAACGGDDSDTSDNSVATNYHDIRATLQGSIFNAIDGARITDSSLAVTLVQGTDYRRASVQTGEREFAGDYAISGIPTSTANNITYRVVSKAEGFQDFEAAVSFAVTTNGLQDNRVNLLANMYMYPLGSFASDVKVNVMFNDEPVVGATVLLNPRSGSNQLTTDTSNTGLFAAQSGFQQAITGLTDAAGLATFPAASLVLGGQYNIDVLPAVHEGTQLAVDRGTATYFTVGSTTNIRNVTMAEAVPGNDNGLYVTSASNTDTDTVTATGVLTIGFSRAVSLVDERNIGATLTNENNAALSTVDAPNSSVNATLSADGLILTLTPVFTTTPVSFNDTNNEALADNNLIVSYTNVLVRIADTTDNAVTYNVFTALDNESGANPSADVQTTKAF